MPYYYVILVMTYGSQKCELESVQAYLQLMNMRKVSSLICKISDAKQRLLTMPVATIRRRQKISASSNDPHGHPSQSKQQQLLFLLEKFVLLGQILKYLGGTQGRTNNMCKNDPHDLWSAGQIKIYGRFGVCAFEKRWGMQFKKDANRF